MSLIAPDDSQEEFDKTESFIQPGENELSLTELVDSISISFKDWSQIDLASSDVVIILCDNFRNLDFIFPDQK